MTDSIISSPDQAQNNYVQSGIPLPIRAQERWLTRRGKVPTDPETLQPISKTDSNNWMCFEQAVSYATANRYLSGVGYFISDQDMFAVIDLDNCRNPETGEIAAWAWKIIKAFNSYTEISTSGKGVHIWVYGTVRGTTRPEVDGHRIEAYSNGAFITVTGKRVEDTPGDIVKSLGATLNRPLNASDVDKQLLRRALRVVRSR